ncbi:MAG: group III truncated hemoglobin [Saprospiraceae bacterium]|nr:group III truncated hemoglobin [Saprospiraceae bacterium]
MKKIEAIEDIKELVYTFYDKVRKDELLGPVFDERIQDRWPAHLEKMVCFWQTVLLDDHTYQGAPFPPHATLPVEKRHFDRWVLLFNETIEDLFYGERADEALWRAEKMSEMFQMKMAYYQERGSHPLM